MPDRSRIILAGGSGFIGAGLASRLIADGYDVTILTRGHAREGSPIRHVHWDARTLGRWSTALDGATAIVNLVGRTVNCRKTPAHRREILESRIDSVRALSAACAACETPPPVWVQTATAHIYGDTADEVLDESSPIGAGFAPTVGVAWEQAFAEARLPHCRRVVFRISFVLGRHGGPLPLLARLARFFLGGRTGNGRQYMSWIHEADLHSVILRSVKDPAMQGIYVATAPKPVTNNQFMRELRVAVGRPWSPPVPETMVRIGAWMMRTDPELALLGRRCMPTRLLAEGFKFQFEELRSALEDLLRQHEQR